MFKELYKAILTPTLEAKLAAPRRLLDDLQSGALGIVRSDAATVVLINEAEHNHDVSALAIPEPGRPAAPVLVQPQRLKKRGVGSEEGRAALIHSIAHIEFNAINLALDAAYRFRGKPENYYTDWTGPACEEAYHFSLLQARLNELSYQYGDFPAHNGLWDLALLTQHDFLARMAVIPRGMEAKGLDVTPGLIDRLRSVQDDRTVEILEIILRDEIGHVAIGDHWFKQACQDKALEPETLYRELIELYAANQIKGPFNTRARLAAGFSEQELTRLRDS